MSARFLNDLARRFAGARVLSIFSLRKSDESARGY